MGKKLKALPTTWDRGPQTLAALGNVDDIRREFRVWLGRSWNMQARRVVRNRDGSRRRETPEEMLRRAAGMFCVERGYRQHVEDAIMPDPATGKPQNPNGVKRARRIDVIESYFRREKIDDRQFDAALRLRVAWEQTMKSPPAIKKLQVDVTPKPDHFIAILMDRIGRYHEVARHAGRQHWRLVAHVVLDNRTLGSLPEAGGGRQLDRAHEALAEALDILADALDT